MIKYLRFIPNYWWYFNVLWGVLTMLQLKAWEGGFMKLAAVLGFLLILSKKTKINGVGLLVLVYIIYSLISGILFSPVDVWQGSIVVSLLSISFFFIGSSGYFSDNAFMKNMRWPILFAMICAVFLYIFPPGWYVSWKTDFITTENMKNSQMFYERLRLSGFWAWPYYLGYMALFFLMIKLKQYFIDNKYDKLSLFEVLTAIIVLFMAQLRVTIAFLVVYYCLLIWYARKSHSSNIRKLVIVGLIGLVVIVLLIVALITFIGDAGLVEYIMSRTVDKNDNLVTERVNLFSQYINSISFLGTGFGMHSHYLVTMDMKGAITDNDYIRLLNEVGILGALTVFAIIIYSLRRAFMNINSYFIEFCILLFLLVAMVGADPLEVPGLHTEVYWYCMGRVCSNFNIARHDISSYGYL